MPLASADGSRYLVVAWETGWLGADQQIAQFFECSGLRFSDATCEAATGSFIATPDHRRAFRSALEENLERESAAFAAEALLNSANRRGVSGGAAVAIAAATLLRSYRIAVRENARNVARFGGSRIGTDMSANLEANFAARMKFHARNLAGVGIGLAVGLAIDAAMKSFEQEQNRRVRLQMLNAGLAPLSAQDRSEVARLASEAAYQAYKRSLRAAVFAVGGA